MEEKVLTLNVKPAGNACNLSCSYCDSIDKACIASIDIPSYQQVLGTIREQYSLFHIVFHGGEPLLAPLSLLEKLVEITKGELRSKCDFQIQTNGLLISPSIIAFLKRNSIKLSISYDPVENNLRYDKASYSIVRNNILRAIESGIPLGILSVAHSKNLSSLRAFVGELIDLNVGFWTINKIRADYSSPLYLSEREYLLLLWDILRRWVEDGLYNQLQIQPLVDLLSPEKNHSCHFNSDIDKCKNIAVVSGKQFSCHCEHFKDSYQTNEKCKRCKIFLVCGAGCSTDYRDDSFCDSRISFFHALNTFKQQIGVPEK